MNKHHIHPETCITDIIHIIYSNVEGQVLILLFLLGFIIKLYDNINDWNRQITTQSCNPKLKIAIINESIINEILKYTLIFISTITFIKDPGAVVGILAVHVLCLHSYEHGFDDPFFIVGIGFLSIFAIIHMIYNIFRNKKSHYSKNNIVELSILACIGYLETILFQEEISDVKFVTRFFVTLILVIFVCLDIFGYFSIFSKNIIQLFVCGIGYLTMDLIMNMYLFFMEPSIYYQLK